MAVTNEKSLQVNKLEAQPPEGIPTTDWKGVKRILRFEFTQGTDPGDAGSTADLVKLPAGNIRVLLAECFMHRSAFTGGRTLDIGWAAYKTPEGADVAADPDAFVDGLDVALAGDALWSEANQGAGGVNGLGLDSSVLVQSRSGVTVQATVAGNTILPGVTLTGYVTYIQD